MEARKQSQNFCAALESRSPPEVEVSQKTAWPGVTWVRATNPAQRSSAEWNFGYLNFGKIGC
jgi:hypothetical protein